MTQRLNLDDIKTAAALASMAVLGTLFPESIQDRLVRRCASLHIALRGSRAGEIDFPSIAPDLDLDAEALEHDFLTGVYRDLLYTVREHTKRGWAPDVRLQGKNHIEDALRRGNGAVLWAFPCTFGGLVGRKALHAEGFEVALLSSDIHPYSGTRFGRRWLNPVRTSVENRYIAERVTFRAGEAAVAVWRLAQLLRDNKLVEIAAIGANDSPARFPFLGGTLHLELGAPRVAGMTGAALLPFFPVPVGRAEFEVCIEPPLQAQKEGDPRGNAIELAREYARIMEQYVRRFPHVWRGWFTRSSWSPYDTSRAASGQLS